MNQFDKFLKGYLKNLKKNNGYKPNFKSVDECRKYFCDIYCSNNDVSILSHTFEHDIINAYGFKVRTIKRRQICVRDRDCILVKEVEEV